MPAKVFVDSNIWLYSLAQSDDVAGDDKHRLATEFLFRLARPVISSQVIREVCSNLIKKSRMPEAAIQVLVQGWYRDCEVVNSTAAQHLLASVLRQHNAFSYWDSLIVAAALDAGCATLFSEDMQHGRVIDSRLSIVNPFVNT